MNLGMLLDLRFFGKPALTYMILVEIFQQCRIHKSVVRILIFSENTNSWTVTLKFTVVKTSM